MKYQLMRRLVEMLRLCLINRWRSEVIKNDGYDSLPDILK